MSVKDRDVEPFQKALKIYTDATISQLNNLQYVPLSASVPSLASGSLCDLMQPFQITSVFQDIWDNPRCAFFSLCLFSLPAFQSRTCQTDHASSCTNFGRTVSPGWGRIRRALWYIRPENVFREIHCGTKICTVMHHCPPTILLIAFSSQATCSRPSVRPSSAALSTPWKSQRWSPQCFSQVETRRLIKQ